MDTVASTLQKVEGLLATVDALSLGHSPQPGSRAALVEIRRTFEKHLVYLQKIATGTSPVAAPTYCSTVLRDLFAFLPIVGFLHRSKNAHNAFEIYDPLLRLAKASIGEDTTLVLSSEWDYSPYTLLQMPTLPSLVLIGLPASEAMNALVSPLAGHEFGHSIWAKENLATEFTDEISSRVVERIRARWDEYKRHFPNIDPAMLETDLFAQQTWSPAFRWSARQCEEVFCDLCGLWLFADAYLYAFSYLVAPGLSSRRVRFYPTLRQRAIHLERAAREWSIVAPDDYAGAFQIDPLDVPGPEAFLTSISDEVTEGLIGLLIKRVASHFDSHGIPLLANESVEEALKAFEMVVPTSAPRGLPALIVAGWRMTQRGKLWPEVPADDPRKREMLNELILKSAQVLEVSHRLSSRAK